MISNYVFYAENHTAGCFLGTIIQEKCGVISSVVSLSEASQNTTELRPHTGTNIECACQETELMRCLPGTSHITYCQMPRGCQRSCLEIFYSGSPMKNQTDLQTQLPVEQSRTSRCSACCHVEPLYKGSVTLERCNKWPVHNSFTLICDSRPCNIPVKCRSMKNLRATLQPVAKGQVPLKQCNKWPVHNSFTLICDSRSCHTPVQHGTRFCRNLQKPKKKNKKLLEFENAACQMSEKWTHCISEDKEMKTLDPIKHCQNV